MDARRSALGSRFTLQEGSIMRLTNWLLLGLGAVSIANGCSGSQNTNGTGGTAACTPGVQIACACPGGAQGAQVCLSDGSGYGTCDGCADASVGSSSGKDASVGPEGGSSSEAGSSDGSSGGGSPDGSASGSSSGSSDGGSESGSDGSGGADGGGCPAGLQCNVACSGGGDTTITGTVYDPAARVPLNGVAVYVPAAPLQPLPRGVLTGADACSCGALFKSGAVVGTTTALDGTFTLHDAPVGAQVPLVLQIGKWRKVVTISVSACTANAQPDKSLHLPASVAAGSDDAMPDIAVSTGSADTLECLLTRMGVASSEYVAGAATPGHVHIFAGGGPSGGTQGVGAPETPAMPGSPASNTSLWASQAQLMPYDLVLLSCEGGETYNANPAALEAYLDAGGRVFASHFHYAWFSGPISSGQSYTAPSDWGTKLATWTAGSNGGTSPTGGTIVQTLNGGSQPFPKGVAFDQWLQNVGALGQGVPAGQLSIYQARNNAVVGASNTASQPWIVSGSNTMAFSFDTPIGAPQACGRAIYSDLHVAGDPSTKDNPPPPGGCATNALSPQEKALEYMVLDLSSCVVPDAAPLPDGGIP
jgi:hypothetical protein